VDSLENVSAADAQANCVLSKQLRWKVNQAETAFSIQGKERVGEKEKLQELNMSKMQAAGIYGAISKTPMRVTVWEGTVDDMNFS
jgi:hypothetical protein